MKISIPKMEKVILGMDIFPQKNIPKIENADLWMFLLASFGITSVSSPVALVMPKEVRKGESIVHVAIREALVNALIHADYQGQGGIIIEKYPDRFEFSNPGSLLISFDQILEGGVSECRNKSLQIMFTMIGAAERAGSGINKIKAGWHSQHWRLPVVKERMHPDRVIWTLPMVSLIPDESLDRLKIKFADRFSKFRKAEVQALVTADIEGYVDNARMRQVTDLHAADITKILQGLVAQGALRQNGQGRWTQYSLPADTDSLQPGVDSLQPGVDSLHPGVDSLHPGVDSLHPGVDSLQPRVDSLQPGVDSLHPGVDSLHPVVDSLHPGVDSLQTGQISSELWKELENIASPARKSKQLNHNEMERIILNICNNLWLTRRQIAELINRNHEGILTRFLTPMVEHGRLKLRYPDKPNRVDQAYQATRTPTQDIEKSHD